MNLYCPSCKSSELKYIGEIPPSNLFLGKILKHPLVAGGKLYQCMLCNLYFRWPHLPQKQLNILYREEEINNWQVKPENRKDWQIAAAWLNTKLIKGRILDIGCFNGEFLNYLGDKW